tara:strand:- start:603 stop:1565 length:963 start_codon:yes stop_codon:yes gene_type:complete
MTRFVYRPVSYDGVIEPGKARGVSITQRGEINVDTLGTPSKRSSLERWGSGSGEVENVMRRASMDVDEDPGTPTAAKSGGKDASPTPFGSGFDSSVGGAHGNGIETKTIPDTGVSIAANPFRDACFRSVTMSDEDEQTRTLRETFLERIVAAMGSPNDDSVWAIRQRTIATVLLYTWVYGNEVFYRAFVCDQTQVRAVILALLKRVHDCNDGPDKGRLSFFLSIVWAIRMTSCFVYRNQRDVIGLAVRDGDAVDAIAGLGGEHKHSRVCHRVFERGGLVQRRHRSKADARSEGHYPRVTVRAGEYILFLYLRIISVWQLD